jgi:hypothetical protein
MDQVICRPPGLRGLEHGEERLLTQSSQKRLCEPTLVDEKLKRGQRQPSQRLVLATNHPRWAECKIGTRAIPDGLLTSNSGNNSI